MKFNIENLKFVLIIYICFALLVYSEPFFRKRQVVDDEDKGAKKMNNKNITNIPEKVTNKEVREKGKSEKQIQKEINKISSILNAKDPIKENARININNPIIKTQLNFPENKNNNIIPSNNNKSVNKSLPNGNNIRNQNSIKKIESVEFALPEINIDKSRKIENFYPYFLKANLISLPSVNPSLMPFLKSKKFVNPSNLKICLDPLCEFCDVNNSIICLQCLPGHYLLDSKCYISCPINFIADVYKRECVSLALRQRNTFSRVTYLKAFSTGSCKNMCGKITSDCSCQPNCTQYGNCCSDFRDCEVLVRTNINKKSECEEINPNCELCINYEFPSRCGQCKSGFFLKNGQCVSFCEIEDKANKENMICYKSQKCLVDNCRSCEEGNPSVCAKCLNGFYLNDNMCRSSCPGLLRADRMNWICSEPSVFAWYWVFPSLSSCRNKCDVGMGINNGMDCSCRDDCVKFGNCCQDVEDYCYQFILS